MSKLAIASLAAVAVITGTGVVVYYAALNVLNAVEKGVSNMGKPAV